MAPVKKRATYDDLLALPEHLVGEIIDGDLIVSPRPASPHARASSILGADLTGPFDRAPGGGGGPGGWWILDEPELHLGGDVIVPDLAGWRRERLPKLPRTAAFELPPDWICEVVSPSTERIDRARKTRVYARAGVGHLWLVNPLVRTLEAWRRDGETWTMAGTFEGNARVRVPPFEAVELELERLWLEPEEPAAP
jgi:Uma2 family endonuclease